MRIEERATAAVAGQPRNAAPDESRLRRWVEHLAVPRHIFVNERHNTWVREELAAAFEECGLLVRIQGPYHNVVGLPPTTNGAPITFIAAHYDSAPDCPGADDNASGLAIMLECARGLASVEPTPRIGFIAFNAEEVGLLGSRDFVTNGLPTLPCAARSAHVLEMVGFRGPSSQSQRLPLPFMPARLKVPNFIALVANGRSNAVLENAISSSASPWLPVFGAKTWGPLHRLLPDLTRSDHFPFWNAGMAAVLWTDTANFRNPNYHRATDTPDTLDYSFMLGVGELLREVVTNESIK
jgi:hypothetical protein